jgi:hypothetical protein
MTDKLSLYNGALNILGERKLASLTENREPRHKLNDIWDNDLIDRVLQHGQWNFATRTVELTASPSVTPSFGYQFAFDKPADHIRTVGVARDEFFDQPLLQYTDEASWWYAGIEVIYVRYVSNDIQYGSDFSLWPANFTEYVEHYMAYKVAPRLTGLDFSDTVVHGKMKAALSEAKGTDAMESPAKFPPKGSWANSRQGVRTGDRGSRTKLIG